MEQNFTIPGILAASHFSQANDNRKIFMGKWKINKIKGIM